MQGRSRLVSIVIPCFNEEKTVEETVNGLLKLKSALDLEIIAVDDGSSDDTYRKLTGLQGIGLLRHDQNKGKGAAVMTGAGAATGEVIVIQDADMEYDPKEIPALVDPILRKECDIVYGSRFKGTISGMTFSHYFGNRLLSYFTSLLCSAGVTDMMTGHKAFRATVFKGLDLKSHGFDFELEVTVKALRKGYSIHEIPIAYSKRQFGEAKIRWIDGIKSMIQLLKYRFELQG
jgi:glycosyltransferase involved in cell wall biosynthesis